MWSRFLRKSLFIGLAVTLFALKSYAIPLSPKAEISLITCDPGKEVYSVYGHSAIRVKDAQNGLDIAFNYGIFDFSSPNFIYRFASGQTDYLLDARRFKYFIKEFVQAKRRITEQVLDLSPDEKQRMFDFLVWNAQPENKVYRYNFFFDNCATRVRDVVLNNINDEIDYNAEGSKKSLRRLVKDYHGKLLWLDFGIDFLVSAPSDREATLFEEMFLPDHLMNYFATASRKGNKNPIIKETHILVEGEQQLFKQSAFTGPFFILFVLFLLVLWLTYKQLKSGKLKPGLDYILYGINGLAGILITWFTLYSEHPAMSPNYNLMWLVPVNLIFAMAWIIKKWRPVLKYYHMVWAGWSILFLPISYFLSQKFHPAFFVFVAIFFVRAAAHSLFILKRKA